MLPNAHVDLNLLHAFSNNLYRPRSASEIWEAPTEAFTDADLDAVCNEICDIGDQVWASPVQGWTDIIERALVAHYGFRDEDTKSADVIAARELISRCWRTARPPGNANMPPGSLRAGLDRLNGWGRGEFAGSR